MKHTRTGLLTFVAALVLVAVEPAAAQSINSRLINNLNFRLLYVAIPITLLVEVILVYTVYKFRNNDDPTPTRENRRLEITWTVATAIILLFVGLAAFTVLGNPYISLTDSSAPGVASADEGNATPEVVDGNLSGAIAPPAGSDAVEIDVLAFQWGWNFTYAEQGVSTGEQIVIPTNQDVYLHTRSEAVLHAVHVPELGLKQDAFPGSYNTIVTNVTQPGSYQLYCAEYCGSGHSSMLANVTAMNESGYQEWLSQQGSGGSENGSNASNGSGNSSDSANSTSNSTSGTSTSSTTSESGTTSGSPRLAAPKARLSAA